MGGEHMFERKAWQRVTCLGFLLGRGRVELGTWVHKAVELAQSRVGRVAMCAAPRAESQQMTEVGTGAGSGRTSLARACLTGDIGSPPGRR